MRLDWPALLLLLGACTGAQLEPLPKQQDALDDRLALHGHLCTRAPQATDFPVKVVFIVDELGSMCISDPPGSQQGNGFCEMPQVVASWPPGQVKPGRVRAIENLLQTFQSEPNVQVAILPFETSPMQPWPAAGGFSRPDSTTVQFCDQLASSLGNGTDTQGALQAAYALIAGDMAQVDQTAPEQLPRSRYEIVFLTDGTPYPRCTASPDLPPQDYATPEQPWLTWQNESTYCTDGPAPGVNGKQCGTQVACVNGQPFQPGTDLNQNYQIFDAVKQIMQLEKQYNVGGLRIDTVLLLNQQAVQLCGTICQDVYGTWPEVDPATYPQETFKAASWLLQQMALLGNGTFQAFTDGAIENLSLAGLDYASLASPTVLKNLFVQALTSVPSPSGRIFDSDGDGLPDTVDNSFTLGTSAFDPDTDSDCFDDGFEVRHANDGFNPVCPDPRGCFSPAGGCTPPTGCACSDGDGDGLPDKVEKYLGSRPDLADSDGDGVPDSVEARYGFDPTHWDAWQDQDTDGDGVSDWDELRANTDPTVPDAQLFGTDGYQYQIQATPQDDGSTCYDFTIGNLKLLQTPSHTGQTDGYNLFKIWWDESPQASIATDYGSWRAACAWAQYSPPGVRVPVGPTLELNKADGTSYFQDLRSLNTKTGCAGQAP